MLMQEPTPKMVEEWEAVWTEYKDRLTPNRRSGREIIEFLQAKYDLTEIFEPEPAYIVAANIVENAPHAEKLPKGMLPIPKTYFLDKTEKSRELYDGVHEIFRDIERIFVGVDLASGIYLVEGNDILWDELCAFQGLDEIDIENVFCVYQYIESLKRFGKLEEVLGEQE